MYEYLPPDFWMIICSLPFAYLALALAICSGFLPIVI